MSSSKKLHPLPSADSTIQTHLEEEYSGMDENETIEFLKREVLRLRDMSSNYYATTLTCNKSFIDGYGHIPEHGTAAAQCKEQLVQIHELDNRPRLNTSSYVNVVFEEEEKDIAIQGLSINLADGAVYPASVDLHDRVVDSIAKLWNCPIEEQGDNFKHFAGSGTVGSTEACLLALLAHKFRWRKWYSERHGLTHEEVIGVVPNIVIPSHYQACWEKAYRYLDIKPKFMYPEFKKFRINPDELKDLIDEKTIMVVGVLGNHYNGTYDPIWEMDRLLIGINEEKGFQVGLHVDAASGGFIAPFQDDVPAWDFRLKSVLSISSSGHKFGESSCGTGWIVFRHREGLSEHIEVEVSYLGGVSHSMTLNFSRPATGVYVQAYKFLRLGMNGYRRKVRNQLETTMGFRDRIRTLKWNGGEPMFEICDPDGEPGLPVFAARVNPKLRLNFDDFALQRAMAEFHWYVSAYHLSFEDFGKGSVSPLCKDEEKNASMFRVVFKSNLTHQMADDLFNRLAEVMEHIKEVEQPEKEEVEEDLKEEPRQKLFVGVKRKSTFISAAEIFTVRQSMSFRQSKSENLVFGNQHAAC